MIALYERAKASIKRELSLEDELTTACWITAHTIAHGWKDKLRVDPDEVIVSGGGCRNAAIMRFLRWGCPNVEVIQIDDLGLKSAAKEAMAFALLGAATLDGIPSNVPSATGARRAVVLGSITPKP